MTATWHWCCCDRCESVYGQHNLLEAEADDYPAGTGWTTVFQQVGNSLIATFTPSENYVCGGYIYNWAQNAYARCSVTFVGAVTVTFSIIATLRNWNYFPEIVDPVQLTGWSYANIRDSRLDHRDPPRAVVGSQLDFTGGPCDTVAASDNQVVAFAAGKVEFYLTHLLSGYFVDWRYQDLAHYRNPVPSGLSVAYSITWV